MQPAREYGFLVNNRFREMAQMAMEDLPTASKQLRKALRLREKYMDIAQQSFPNVTRRFIDPTNTCAFPGNDTASQHSSQADGESGCLFTHSHAVCCTHGTQCDPSLSCGFMLNISVFFSLCDTLPLL